MQVCVGCVALQVDRRDQMASQTAVMLAASTSEQAWPFFLVVVALELILYALCHMLEVVAASSTAMGPRGLQPEA